MSESRALERPAAYEHPAANVAIDRVLGNALGRVVVIREALEDGDTGYAYAVATDLEHDLAGERSRLLEAPAAIGELREAA
jgi:hypothetical protein